MVDHGQTGWDEEALAEHAGFVRALARALVRDDVLAEDLAQVSLTAALAHPPGAINSMRSWLARVVHNLAINQGKKERKRPLRERGATLPREAPDPVEVAARQEVARALVERVQGLPEPYRSAIHLRYFEEFSPGEMSESLGVPLGTVKSRLRKALQLLRQKMDARWGGDRNAWSVTLFGLVGKENVAAATTLGGAGVSGVWGGLMALSIKKATACAAIPLLLLATWILLGWDLGLSSPIDPIPPQEKAGPATADLEAAGRQECAAPPLPQGSRARVDRREIPAKPLPTTGSARIRFQHKDDGSPIPHVMFKVTLTRWNSRIDFSSRGLARSFRADESGECLLSDLPFLVKWPDEVAACHRHRVTRGWVRITPVVGGERTLSVYPDRDNLLVYQPNSGFNLTGEVVDDAGMPVPDAQIYLFDMRWRWDLEYKYDRWNNTGWSHARGFHLTRSDQQGRFHIAGARSSWFVAARKRGFAPSKAWQFFRSNRSETRLTLRLAASDRVITGRVTDDNGRPIAGVRVTLVPQFRYETILRESNFKPMAAERARRAGIPLNRTVVEYNFARGRELISKGIFTCRSAPFDCLTGTDGTIRFDSIHPVRHKLTFRKSGYLSVTRVVEHQSGRSHLPVTMLQGEQPKVDFAKSQNKRKTVEGRLLGEDATPLARWRVQLSSRLKGRGRYSPMDSVTTDPEGRFKLPLLPGMGPHRLEIHHPEQAFKNPMAIRHFDRASDFPPTISLTAAEHRGCFIVGRLDSSHQVNEGGSRIVVTRTATDMDTPYLATRLTDRDFRIGPLPAGRYTVFLVAGPARHHLGTVDLVAGDNRLQPESEIGSGRLCLKLTNPGRIPYRTLTLTLQPKAAPDCPLLGIPLALTPDLNWSGPLVAGDYTLKLTGVGLAQLNRPLKIYPSEKTHLTLEMVRPAPCTVTFAKVPWVNDHPRIRIHLYDRAGQLAAEDLATCNRDGFTMRFDLPAGRYRAVALGLADGRKLAEQTVTATDPR